MAFLFFVIWRRGWLLRVKWQIALLTHRAVINQSSIIAADSYVRNTQHHNSQLVYNYELKWICFTATAGETFTSLSYQFRVGRSTIAKIVPETCQVIYEELKDKYFQVIWGTMKFFFLTNFILGVVHFTCSTLLTCFLLIHIMVYFVLPAYTTMCIVNLTKTNV